MNACGDSKGDVEFSTSPFVYDYQLLTKISRHNSRQCGYVDMLPFALFRNINRSCPHSFHFCVHMISTYPLLSTFSHLCPRFPLIECGKLFEARAVAGATHGASRERVRVARANSVRAFRRAGLAVPAQHKNKRKSRTSGSHILF